MTRQEGKVVPEITGNKNTVNYNLFKAVTAKKLYQLGTPVKIICKDLNISKTTLYSYLKYEELNYENYLRHNSKIENAER